jgi:hypothetical protein
MKGLVYSSVICVHGNTDGLRDPDIFKGGFVMMKTMVLMTALFFLGAALVTAGEQAEKAGGMAWFDLENCAFCKHLTKDPQLMDNVKWENYDISNGVITITIVKPEFKKAYMEAEMAMMDLGKKMEAGEISPEKVKMCGHCQAYGKLLTMGANMEHAQGDLAEVMIITSDKPEVVAEIKAFSKRNQEEMAKMEKTEQMKKTEKKEKPTKS